MNKQAPKENFTDLAADLAMTIADCLDHSDCPRDLADALREISDEVQNAIGPSVSELLRALASVPKSKNGRTRAEGETPVLDSQDAILGESDAGSQALAMTN